MTKLEQAARQALGALEVATTPLAKDRQEVLRAITTLREALSGGQALSAAPAGPWSLGEMTGNWRDIDLPDHGAVMRIVWKMEDDDGRNEKLEAQAHAVVAALNAASPTPPAEARRRYDATAEQAAPKAAPVDAIDEAMRERDDAVDFIDALLDEVLSHERPEWSNLYGRADALNDVQERMAALHKPAVDKAWGQFQSAKAAPQQEAQAPCPTCAALARTVMLDQVSFDRKPDCYGIRQITDDEGVEEWEDIRTSPDVAREEANDMMATGRGEIYEVVPLYTAPLPAPDCHHRPPCDECAAPAAQGGKT